MSEVQVDAGIMPSKFSTSDELVGIMRRVLRERPNINQAEAVEAWITELRGQEDYDLLREAVEKYVGAALWRRCVVQDTAPRTSRSVAQVKEIIAAEIVLWTWKLPTTGRSLADCTFQEVSDAAPVCGRFLAKLAAVGAPGALIRQVFANKDALQEFWRTAQ